MQCYVTDEEKFEWLDRFDRKNRSSQTTTMLTKSSLYEQLRDIKGNVYDVYKVKLLKDYNSQKLTDLILNEKKDGLFVTLLKDQNGNR